MPCFQLSDGISLQDSDNGLLEIVGSLLEEDLPNNGEQQLIDSPSATLSSQEIDTILSHTLNAVIDCSDIEAPDISPSPSDRMMIDNDLQSPEAPLAGPDAVLLPQEIIIISDNNDPITITNNGGVASNTDADVIIIDDTDTETSDVRAPLSIRSAAVELAVSGFSAGTANFIRKYMASTMMNTSSTRSQIMSDDIILKHAIKNQNNIISKEIKSLKRQKKKIVNVCPVYERPLAKKTATTTQRQAVETRKRVAELSSEVQTTAKKTKTQNSRKNNKKSRSPAVESTSLPVKNIKPNKYCDISGSARTSMHLFAGRNPMEVGFHQPFAQKFPYSVEESFGDLIILPKGLQDVAPGSTSVPLEHIVFRKGRPAVSEAIKNGALIHRAIQELKNLQHKYPDRLSEGAISMLNGLMSLQMNDMCECFMGKDQYGDIRMYIYNKQREYVCQSSNPHQIKFKHSISSIYGNGLNFLYALAYTYQVARPKKVRLLSTADLDLDMSLNYSDNTHHTLNPELIQCINPA